MFPPAVQSEQLLQNMPLVFKTHIKCLLAPIINSIPKYYDQSSLS